MTDDVSDPENEQAAGAERADSGADVPVDNEWELAIQVPFDEHENHDLTSAIIVAVAEVEGVSPSEIKEPPLYEVLDVVALEAAFFGSKAIGRSSSGHREVEFMYRDHRIVVRSDAWVQVYAAVQS